jgi:hypothetical protein
MFVPPRTILERALIGALPGAFFFRVITRLLQGSPCEDRLSVKTERRHRRPKRSADRSHRFLGSCNAGASADSTRGEII